MSDIAAACGWLMALVLTWAAVAKLAAPSRTAAGFRSLGIPLPAAAAVGLPVTELVAAGLLVVMPPVGALVSLTLLGAFTVFLIGALRRGATMPCGCFGSARPEPITPAALLRNAMLALAAGTAGFGPALALPALEAIVTVGTAAAMGLVLIALAEVHATTGRLWDNRLDPGPGGAA